LTVNGIGQERCQLCVYCTCFMILYQAHNQLKQRGTGSDFRYWING